MSKYTFTFKKDDIYVEFTTEDKEVVERQFQIWVLNADEYVRNMEKRTYKGQTVNSINSTKSQVQAQPETKPAQQSAPQNTETKTYQQQYSQPQTNSYAEQASSLLKTINSLQQPEQGFVQQPILQTQAQPVQQPQPAPQYFQQPVEQNIPAPQPVPQPQYQEQPLNSNQPQNFESVLEQKIESPTFEPQQNVDQIFLNLINSKNTKDKFHYLMITAYYLTEFGKQERFTLKQINSKLIQNVGEVIDHQMLQEAINQGFIELIPDPTGLAQVGEYRLTRQGEEFFAYKI